MLWWIVLDRWDEFYSIYVNDRFSLNFTVLL